MPRWRLAMLVVGAVAAAVIAALSCVGLVEVLWPPPCEADSVTHPLWGRLSPLAITAARLLLLAGAVAALLLSRRPERSRQVLAGCWALALLLHLLPALVPFAWHWRLEGLDPEQVTPVLAKAMPAMLLGVFLDQFPLLPALAMGCTRAGMLQVRGSPQPAVGGVVVALASLVMFVTGFVLLCVLRPLLAHDAWFAAGLGAVVAHYGIGTVGGYAVARCDRPRQWARRLLAWSGPLLWGGGAALVVGLFDVEVQGVPLLVRPGHEGLLDLRGLWGFGLEILGRGALTAVVMADLLARAALPPSPSPGTAALT